jgi:hypothetical protein
VPSLSRETDSAVVEFHEAAPIGEPREPDTDLRCVARVLVVDEGGVWLIDEGRELREHEPGGKSHDQEKHGNWAGGERRSVAYEKKLDGLGRRNFLTEFRDSQEGVYEAIRRFPSAGVVPEYCGATAENLRAFLADEGVEDVRTIYAGHVYNVVDGWVVDVWPDGEPKAWLWSDERLVGSTYDPKSPYRNDDDESLLEHRPGGQDHDQSAHGNWADGGATGKAADEEYRKKLWDEYRTTPEEEEQRDYLWSIIDNVDGWVRDEMGAGSRPRKRANRRRFMRKVLAETLPGGKLHEFHPGRVRVYRGGQLRKGRVSSWTTSIWVAQQYERNFGDDALKYGYMDESHPPVATMIISEKMPALDVGKLLNSQGLRRQIIPHGDFGSREEAEIVTLTPTRIPKMEYAREWPTLKQAGRIERVYHKPRKKKRKKREGLQEHTPGGQQHDQELHGNWATGGAGGARHDVPAEKFIELRDKSAYPVFLSPVEAGDLTEHRLMVRHEGTVGVALSPEGDIQNLFNNGGPKRAAADLLIEAVEAGGRTLDCFDIYLPKLYAQLGFVETGRMKFNREYAPEGWNYEEDGEPDVVFMRWDGYPKGKEESRARAKGPKKDWIKTPRSDRYYEDWDEAKLDSRRAGDSGSHRRREGVGSRGEIRGVDSEGRTGNRGPLTEHYPGGQQHDQDEHGNWAQGVMDRAHAAVHGPPHAGATFMPLDKEDRERHHQALHDRQEGIILVERLYKRLNVEGFPGANESDEYAAHVLKDWSMLSDEAKSETEQNWHEGSTDDFLENAQQNWRDNVAQEDAMVAMLDREAMHSDAVMEVRREKLVKTIEGMGFTAESVEALAEKNPEALDRILNFDEDGQLGGHHKWNYSSVMRKVHDELGGKASQSWAKLGSMRGYYLLEPGAVVNYKALEAVILDGSLQPESPNDTVFSHYSGEWPLPPGGVPEQGTLPGVEPPPPDMFPPMYKMEFERDLMVNLAKGIDDELVGNQRIESPSDSYFESEVEQQQEYYWEAMSDDEKVTHAQYLLDKPDSDSPGFLGMPDRVEVFSDGENFKRSKALGRVMTAERTKEVLIERGLHSTAGSPPRVELFNSIWSDWKSNSAKGLGYALQVAARDELGANYYRTRGEHKTAEKAIAHANEVLHEVGGYDGLKAYVRAQWETTQWMADKAGVKEARLWRGIYVPKSQIEREGGTQTLWPEKLLSGEGPPGAEWLTSQSYAEQARALPELGLKQSGAASFTTQQSIANSWGGTWEHPEPSQRVVIDAMVPVTAMLSLPVFGQNVFGEQEVVVVGLPWKRWSAWEDEAPYDWDPSKHPRGADGRFIQSPEAKRRSELLTKTREELDSLTSQIGHAKRRMRDLDGEYKILPSVKDVDLDDGGVDWKMRSSLVMPALLVRDEGALDKLFKGYVDPRIDDYRFRKHDRKMAQLKSWLSRSEPFRQLQGRYTSWFHTQRSLEKERLKVAEKLKELWDKK